MSVTKVVDFTSLLLNHEAEQMKFGHFDSADESLRSSTHLFNLHPQSGWGEKMKLRLVNVKILFREALLRCVSQELVYCVESSAV